MSTLRKILCHNDEIYIDSTLELNKVWSEHIVERFFTNLNHIEFLNFTHENIMSWNHNISVKLILKNLKIFC